MSGNRVGSDDRCCPAVDASVGKSCPLAEDESGRRDWSDGALFAAVVSRHRDAYAELYRRHAASVAAATQMILGNGPACDDVVADVFVRFWLSPEKFDPDRGSLLGFLRLTARSRSIDLLRTEKRRRRREDDELFAERAPSPEIDSAFLASEAASELRRAVGSLRPNERDAIRLAFFHGMSYRAVAVHLGVAEGTVKSRIRNGLRHLRFSDDLQAHVEGRALQPVETIGAQVTGNAVFTRIEAT